MKKDFSPLLLPPPLPHLCPPLLPPPLPPPLPRLCPPLLPPDAPKEIYSALPAPELTQRTPSATGSQEASTLLPCLSISGGKREQQERRADRTRRTRRRGEEE